MRVYYLKISILIEKYLREISKKKREFSLIQMIKKHKLKFKIK